MKLQVKEIKPDRISLQYAIHVIKFKLSKLDCICQEIKNDEHQYFIGYLPDIDPKDWIMQKLKANFK